MTAQDVIILRERQQTELQVIEVFNKAGYNVLLIDDTYYSYGSFEAVDSIAVDQAVNITRLIRTTYSHFTAGSQDNINQINTAVNAMPLHSFIFSKNHLYSIFLAG